MDKRLTFLLALHLGLLTNLSAQDDLLNIMQDELKRNMTNLSGQEAPPYYISYRVEETISNDAEASFGNLMNSDELHDRVLTTMVRAGGLDLDNFHEVRDEGFGRYFSYFPSGVSLPLGNDKDAISQVLWKSTNSQYRQACDRLAKVKANVAVKVEAEDKSPDFTNEKTENYYEPPLKLEDITFDKTLWEERVKKISAVFLNEPDIFNGKCNVSYKIVRKYFVSSEGVSIAQNLTYARLAISGNIKSDDGMVMPMYKTYFAFKPENLPNDETILKDADEMVKKLKTIKTAPVVEPYAGPAILSGGSAGVFFHEIFGHRIEGKRQKSEEDGQTFKKKIDEEVLPSHMNVILDPTIKQYNGEDLNGYYIFDDEGIRGQKVNVVEKGILKNFIMSRCPIQNFSNSNGHGRAEAGMQPVTRQSNLIVETTNPLSMDALRKKLIDECKAQGKEYGYLFMNVTGGFTMTGRFIPNAFNVMPTEVYRIFVDGRPDEMVRGVDLVGTPLAMFSQITDAGNSPEIFTGTCGAESGMVPVTCISPALLVKQIEMQKKSKDQDRPPILARPDTNPK
ncbi:MAG: TldD/PmbA family protein [Bacteroidia bacterium]|nr:TldD/PmbA family protein [Bacteroidia bacterium]